LRQGLPSPDEPLRGAQHEWKKPVAVPRSSKQHHPPSPSQSGGPQHSWATWLQPWEYKKLEGLRLVPWTRRRSLVWVGLRVLTLSAPPTFIIRHDNLEPPSLSRKQRKNENMPSRMIAFFLSRSQLRLGVVSFILFTFISKQTCCW